VARVRLGSPDSPVIGGGRIWVLDTNAGVLHALDPATGKSLGQVAVGAANRFATPALYGADVIVPTLLASPSWRTSYGGAVSVTGPPAHGTTASARR